MSADDNLKYTYEDYQRFKTPEKNTPLIWPSIHIVHYKAKYAE